MFDAQNIHWVEYQWQEGEMDVFSGALLIQHFHQLTTTALPGSHMVNMKLQPAGA